MKTYDRTAAPGPKKSASIKVYPAIAAQRNDGFVPGPWTIEEGRAMRGAASCDVNNRVLQVPGAPDQVARLVRAHELTHARVSPTGDVLERAWAEGIHPHALACAEEARVNFLVAQAGFDVEFLCDGTEKDAGEKVAQLGDWPEALCFAAAAKGTGAEKPYLAGIRKGNKDWVTPMRQVLKRIIEILEEQSTSYIASTELLESGYPLGFEATTLPIARLLTTYMSAEIPDGPEALRAFKRGLHPGNRRPVSGKFANLVWLDQPEFERVNLRGDTRKSRPSLSGVSMRYPNRYLTDPQKRVMGKKARADGGIVIIDQSGSMDLSADVVREFAKRHPRARLVGYSHRPGDGGVTPNAWILAANGKVATSEIPANIGNGVDGPILRWAISQRRGSEPLVWVCDGQVTDSHDHPGHHLSVECAELVAKHKIRIVPNLYEVANALAHPRGVRPSEYPRLGRVGRVLADRSKKN